ncbi:hypothetical protein QBC39DRAFT_433938 [Podospora conica]|nr:hypothetical protein QBC39DRAFT_433938 [Schizothecium conicum]
MSGEWHRGWSRLNFETEVFNQAGAMPGIIVGGAEADNANVFSDAIVMMRELVDVVGRLLVVADNGLGSLLTTLQVLVVGRLLVVADNGLGSLLTTLQVLVVGRLLVVADNGLGSLLTALQVLVLKRLLVVTDNVLGILFVNFRGIVLAGFVVVTDNVLGILFVNFRGIVLAGFVVVTDNGSGSLLIALRVLVMGGFLIAARRGENLLFAALEAYSLSCRRRTSPVVLEDAGAWWDGISVVSVTFDTWPERYGQPQPQPATSGRRWKRFWYLARRRLGESASGEVAVSCSSESTDSARRRRRRPGPSGSLDPRRAVVGFLFLCVLGGLCIRLRLFGEPLPRLLLLVNMVGRRRGGCVGRLGGGGVNRLGGSDNWLGGSLDPSATTPKKTVTFSDTVTYSDQEGVSPAADGMAWSSFSSGHIALKLGLKLPAVGANECEGASSTSSGVAPLAEFSHWTRNTMPFSTSLCPSMERRLVVFHVPVGLARTRRKRLPRGARASLTSSSSSYRL